MAQITDLATIVASSGVSTSWRVEQKTRSVGSFFFTQTNILWVANVGTGFNNLDPPPGGAPALGSLVGYAIQLNRSEWLVILYEYDAGPNVLNIGVFTNAQSPKTYQGLTATKITNAQLQTTLALGGIFPETGNNPA